MADTERHPFGGGIGDWVFQIGGGGALSVAAGATVQFWSARSGGTLYSNLSEDANGTVAIAGVVSQDGTTTGYAAGDLPMFYGPPGIRAMWASADGGPRKLITSNDLATDVATAVSAEVFTTKGDLVVGTGVAAADRLGAGANGQVLTVDSTQDTGLRWQTPSGGGGTGEVGTTSDTLWVAAVDAPAQYADAPYVCDGVADNVQIQAALDNPYGLRVGLSPGGFQLAAPIQLNGLDNVQTELSRYLTGSGNYATTLTLASGQAGAIFLGKAVSAHVCDLRIVLPAGAGHGIYATKSTTPAAVNRSFFHSSIRNVMVVGPFSGSTHTGWAFSLGSGQRFTVDNVSAIGVGNGLRIVGETNGVICGDAVITRANMRVIGAGAVAYQVSAPLGGAEHVTFDVCHGVCDTASTGTTCWKFDGAASYIRVRNSRAENFTTTVSTASTCFDIDVDIARALFTSPPAGATFAAVGGYSSRFRVGQLYVVTGTVSAVTETSVAGTQPNQFDLEMIAETGATITATMLSGIILRSITTGAGTIAGILKQKNQRGRILTFNKAGAVTVAAGVIQIYNDTGQDLVLRSARAGLGTAFTTGTTTVDININGTTIFSNQSNRPQIGANSKTSGKCVTGVEGVVWPSTQAITVDVDAIGSAGSGADLHVQIDTFN